jgi:hypothetical protein
MKTINQVRKDSSAAPSARQGKTTSGKTVTVIFYSPDDEKELMRVDFPEPFFAAIKHSAKKLGVSLAKFLERAIENKLCKAGIDTAGSVNQVTEGRCAMDGSQRSNVKTSPKLTYRKTGRVIHDPAEWITIHVSSQIRRHLRAYGRSNVVAANGNLSLIAGAALKVAMLHRKFIEEASCRFVRYAKAEGFDSADGHEKLMKSLLAAR